MFRRFIIHHGERLARAVSAFQARRSLIGDPPVFDAAEFEFTAELEANWQKVLKEYQQLSRYLELIPLFEEVSTDQKSISKGNTWRTLFLYGFGERVHAVCEHLPETSRLLSRIPNLQNAFFSILEPGSHIPAHRGLTKGMLTCHLALKVPAPADTCRLRVDDETVQWAEGKVLIFDDTYDHEVWNDSSETRAVLLFHVDRPMSFLGRLSHRFLLSLVKLSPYVREPKKRIDRLSEQLAEAIKHEKQLQGES